MALEQILKALEDHTDRENGELERSATEEIAAIQTAARLEAKRVHQEQIDVIQKPLQLEQSRILNRAKLEALQIVLQTREQIMEVVIELSAKRLAKLSESTSYPSLLCHLTQEAIDALESTDEYHIRVRACDEELMNSIVQNLDIQATVTDDLREQDSQLDSQYGSLGGLVMSTRDGRIQVRNTLDLRLQRVAVLYRSRIAESIFSNARKE